MLVKRFALAAISGGFGFVLMWLIVRFIADTNLQEYGFLYSFFTALAIACAIGIWLDKFLETEILPK